MNLLAAPLIVYRRDIYSALGVIAVEKQCVVKDTALLCIKHCTTNSTETTTVTNCNEFGIEEIMPPRDIEYRKRYYTVIFTAPHSTKD